MKSENKYSPKRCVNLTFIGMVFSPHFAGHFYWSIMRTNHIAIFGNIKIPRAYCKECKCESFVLEGKFACCNKPFSEKLTEYLRESIPPQFRRLPPLCLRKEQLAFQNHCCFYCERRIGFIVWRKDKHIKLKLHWDHFVPYSLTQDNRFNNFVASCHVCNGIKSNKIFMTTDEAKIYILERRKEKGYR